MTREPRDDTATVSRETARLAQMAWDELAPTSAQASAHAWDGVLDRLDGRRRRLRRVFAAACVATMIPLAIIAWRAPRREKPLELSFTGARLGDHGQITRTSDLASSLLHFSDGTEVELRTDAAAHMLEVHAHGATLALEHGAAQFRVAPLPGARWAVSAGPFRVDVKGTVFDLEWAPGPGTFRLQLRRGSVAVTGPLSAEPILLRDQRELLIDLPRHEVKIIDQGRAPAVRPKVAAPTAPVAAPSEAPTRAAAPSEAPAPVAAPSGSSVPVAAPSGSSVPVAAPSEASAPVAAPSEGPAPAAVPSEGPTAPPTAHEASSGRPHRGQPSWQALFAAGRLDRILGEAEDAGFDASLSHRSNEDLAALADAARYRGRADLARRTLLSQRSRFPRSQRAVEAAFLLGRLDESSAGAAQALAWYDDYLAQAPRGRYAAEALGRKMLVVQKLRGTDQARPLADEYLRRYPEGGYAELAHKLTLH